MAFHFSRDTKVFMRWHATADGTDDALYEIPVLDGFSFSQATNTSEITLNEAADGSTLNSKRGRAMFNDSFAPAEWSFSTYMRPTTSANANAYVSNGHAGTSKKFAVEGPLWGAMSATTYAYATVASAAANTWTAATHEPNTFKFENSNKVALGVFDLFFVLGASGDTNTASYDTGTDGVTVYKITNCSVGSASIDFDIDGLAQVAWSGQGAIISEVAQLTTTADGAGETSKKGLINEGIGTTSNFIRQKLTSMTLKYDAAASTGTDLSGSQAASGYVLTLTGGNITIENNLSYLTPETLGTVNQPLGHVMGTRTVSGNFTCYLNTVEDGSAELFENIIEGTSQITNAFDMDFAIGGSGQTPRVDVSIPRAHLELPTHSIEDVISLDVNFHGLPVDMTDNQIAAGESEIVITYES